MERPPASIPTCNQGHHVCEDCSKKVANCPTCKGMFTGSRNYLGEELARKYDEIKVSYFNRITC